MMCQCPVHSKRCSEISIYSPFSSPTQNSPSTWGYFYMIIIIKLYSLYFLSLPPRCDYFLICPLSRSRGCFKPKTIINMCGCVWLVCVALVAVLAYRIVGLHGCIFPHVTIESEYQMIIIIRGQRICLQYMTKGCVAPQAVRNYGVIFSKRY